MKNSYSPLSDALKEKKTITWKANLEFILWSSRKKECGDRFFDGVTEVVFRSELRPDPIRVVDYQRRGTGVLPTVLSRDGHATVDDIISMRSSMRPTAPNDVILTHQARPRLV